MATPADQVSVTVIMIFKDAEAFFDEAVESVFRQTHPRVELLLCDDGSRDASTSLARRWAARHPTRVRYLQHRDHAHRGMSASRNLGIAAANGDLVAFLDADDVWEPEHLADDVTLLCGTPEAGMVCGSALEWRSWREPGAEDTWTPLPAPPATVVPPPRMLTATLRRGDFRTLPCTLLVRRQVLLGVGGAEDSFTGMFEDQALLAKLHLSHATVISRSRTARYRQHLSSATARARRRGTYDPDAPNRSMEAYLAWLERRLQLAPGRVDPELRSALAAAGEPYASWRRRWGWRARAVLRCTLPSRALRALRTAVALLRRAGPDMHRR